MQPEEQVSDFDLQLENLRKMLKEPGNSATYKITIEHTAPKLVVEGGHRVKVSGEGADAKYETAKYIPKIQWESKNIFSQTVQNLDLPMVVKAVNGL